MGDTASNEAKIVVTTDAAQFAQFMVDAARAFHKMEAEGKTAFSRIDKEAAAFSQNVSKYTSGVQGLAAKALGTVLGNAMRPAQQALDGALAGARSWRQESTRIMGQTGQDWRQVGAQIDEVSRKTTRLPDDVSTYLSSVKRVSGSWKTALEDVKDYSNLSRYLGRSTLAEMAPLKEIMSNSFGIRGEGRVTEFFDSAIRGAQRLGQEGRQAAETLEKLAPMIAQNAPGGKRGAEQLRGAGAYYAALLKQGLSPEKAEEAVRQTAGYYQGHQIPLERQFRSMGRLKKGEHLTDEWGQWTHSLPEMLQWSHELAGKTNKRLGGDAEKLFTLRAQNLPPLMSGAVAHAPEILKDIKTAMEAGAAPGQSPIGNNAKAMQMTPELQRQYNDILLAQGARKTIGEAKLDLEDRGAKAGVGIYGRYLQERARNAEAVMEDRKRGGFRGWFARLPFNPNNDELKQRVSESRAQLLEMQNPDAFDASKSSILADYRANRRGPEMSVATPTGAPMSSTNSQAQRDQAKQTADALAAKVLTVRFAQPIGPLSGGGNQNN